MNWEEIGAIGDVVGATAVVVSLIYLATQVLASTRLARAEASLGPSFVRYFEENLLQVSRRVDT